MEEEFDEEVPMLQVEGLSDRPDYYLRLLTYLSNSTSSEFGLTLLIGGRLVTGTLIPMQMYLSELANSIAPAEAVQENAGSSLADYFREVSKSIQAQAVDNETYEVESTAHIHLRDAVVFSTQPRGINIGLWRGRLASVEGWTLGVLNGS